MANEDFKEVVNGYTVTVKDGKYVATDKNGIVQCRANRYHVIREFCLTDGFKGRK